MDIFWRGELQADGGECARVFMCVYCVGARVVMISWSFS